MLDDLNVMGLDSPRSAILSAVIFNASIIVALIPLALRGVKFVPTNATRLLRRNLLIYGAGGIIVPFIGIKLIDMVISCAGGGVMLRRQVLPAVVMVVIMTVLCGLVYTFAFTGFAQVVAPGKANGSLVQADGKDVGSELIGQAWVDKKGEPLPQYFQSRPSAATNTTDNGYDPTLSLGSNWGPANPDLLEGGVGAGEGLPRAERPRRTMRRCRSTR